MGPLSDMPAPPGTYPVERRRPQPLFTGHSWLFYSGSCIREGEVACGCGLRPRLCLRVG